MNQLDQRRGTVLICVLSCLGIVIAIVLATMQSSLRGRREIRMQRQLLQTELLCEAGVRHAIQKYHKSSDYRGEKWSPKFGLPSFSHATIEIRIKSIANDADRVNAEIVASLASSENSNDRMQRSRRLTLPSVASTAKRKLEP